MKVVAGETPPHPWEVDAAAWAGACLPTDFEPEQLPERAVQPADPADQAQGEARWEVDAVSRGLRTVPGIDPDIPSALQAIRQLVVAVTV